MIGRETRREKESEVSNMNRNKDRTTDIRKGGSQRKGKEKKRENGKDRKREREMEKYWVGA